MRRPTRQSEAAEPAVVCIIDEQFVKGRSWLVLLSLLGALVLFWVFYLVGEMENMTLTVMIVITPIMAIVFAITCFLGGALAKRGCVVLTETRVIVLLAGSEKVLHLSKEAPVVVRRSASGKYWELASSDRPKKPIKIPYRAFPHLGKFFEKEGQGTVTVEADGLNQ